jgi:hypothetical protein
MGLKEGLERAGRDIKDTANETKHRVVAEGEHVKRETLGDEMTLPEKGGSVLNEAKNRTQAEIDKTKREVRDSASR